MIRAQTAPPPPRGVPQMRGMTDDLLVETLVTLGQPRHAAEMLRRDPALRLQAATIRVWYEDAQRGVVDAKQRLDYCRESWDKQRRAELIHDDPRRFE